MLQNLIKNSILDFCSLSTLQCYKQTALRKKELIAFFEEYFNESRIRIGFQFHNSKSQESCFNLYMLDSAVLKEALRKKLS